MWLKLSLSLWVKHWFMTWWFHDMSVCVWRCGCVEVSVWRCGCECVCVEVWCWFHQINKTRPLQTYTGVGLHLLHIHTHTYTSAYPQLQAKPSLPDLQSQHQQTPYSNLHTPPLQKLPHYITTSTKTITTLHHHHMYSHHHHNAIKPYRNHYTHYYHHQPPPHLLSPQPRTHYYHHNQPPHY